jgi:hypothetical protein
MCETETKSFQIRTFAYTIVMGYLSRENKRHFKPLNIT